MENIHHHEEEQEHSLGILQGTKIKPIYREGLWVDTTPIHIPPPKRDRTSHAIIHHQKNVISHQDQIIE